MKTFDLGHNPENLPLAPGYRWLSKDEPHRVGDEIWATGNRASGQDGHLQWCALTNSGSWTVTQPNALWSYRRALCVDDPFAPPPDQWKEGYEMLAGPDRGPGVEYWSRDKRSWRHCMTVGCAYQPEYYYRRPLRSAPVVPNQLIIVRVGDIAPLLVAVQQLAFDAGWSWGAAGTSGAKQLMTAHRIAVTDSTMIFLHADKTMSYGNRHVSVSNTDLFLDARTDMGKLIDILAPRAPVGPTINGHVGVYVKGAATITFGCAVIPLRILSRVVDIMSYVTEGSNRTMADIGLSSGVRLTRDQIRAIIEYVHEVNVLP